MMQTFTQIKFWTALIATQSENVCIHSIVRRADL